MAKRYIPHSRDCVCSECGYKKRTCYYCRERKPLADSRKITLASKYKMGGPQRSVWVCKSCASQRGL